MSKKLTLFLLILSLFIVGLADNAYSQKKDFQVHLGAYVDTYIATDNDKTVSEDTYPSPQFRPFSYIDGAKGQFNLNVAQLTCSINFDNLVRGKATIHTGNLPTQGYQVQAVQEAYVGVRALTGFWVDAGYFLTHIGGEKLLPKDNWLSSHSMVTYFEPFFQAGVRGTYKTEQFTAQLQILNGCGIFNDNNDNKSFAWFIGFDPNEKISLFYAAIIGNEENPGNPSKTEILHNICGSAKFSESIEAKAQIDFATKADAVIDNGDLTSGSFMGFSAQARYHFNKKFSTTFRFSFVSNEDNIFGLNNMLHFDDAMGFTLGFEYRPVEFSYIRIEGRLLQFDKDHEIFSDGKDPTNSRMELMLNMGVWLD